MKRRHFFGGAAAMGAASLFPGESWGKGSKSNETRQIIELIKYRLHTGARNRLVEEFYKNAAIPALNRMGVDRVGVFKVRYGQNEPSLYVLIPHNSAEDLMNYQSKLMDDAEFRSAAKEYLEVSMDNAAYVRKDSWVYKAFKYMPKVEAREDLIGEDHVLELRIYEAHSYLAGQLKIEMFNEGGEIEIFRKTGLTPVFFGEAMIGAGIPNLTYMLTFKDMNERDANWKKFVDHPDWKKLAADEYYKPGAPSNITDIVLRALPFSQI